MHPQPCNLNKWEKCPYSLLIASMINVFFADVKSGRYDAHKADEAAPLPVKCEPIMKSLVAERGGAIDRCFAWGVDRRVPPPVVGNTGWRLTSHDTAWSFDPPANCEDGVGKARAVGASSAASATPPRCPHHKPGFTSFTPGSEAHFQLPLAGSTRMVWSQSTSWNATMYLSYLTSYEGMGVASVHCENGCTCDEIALDAHTGSSFVSIWQTSVMSLELLGDSTSCGVCVTVLNQTSSGHHKFKLASMTLRWAADAAERSKCVCADGEEAPVTRHDGLGKS